MLPRQGARADERMPARRQWRAENVRIGLRSRHRCTMQPPPRSANGVRPLSAGMSAG